MSNSPAKGRLDVEVFNAAGRTRLQHRPFVRDLHQLFADHGSGPGEIRVIFLADADHTDMNRRFLEHHYSTDVITFSIEDVPLEGEIYVNLDQARLQADEAGTQLYPEVRRLVIHGMLHLLGYDDATAAERLEMRALEDEYLKR